MAVVKTVFEDAILKKQKAATDVCYVAGDSDINLVLGVKVGSEPTDLLDQLEK